MIEKGRVTIPSEEGFAEQTKMIAEKWGADAIRDSDGTELDAAVKALGKKIYAAYFPTRGHNEFIEKHMDECPQMYLMSERVVAMEEQVTIPFMETYYEEQLTPNYHDNPKQYWEVINRTTGEIISVDLWDVNTENHTVTIHGTIPWHQYTVSFLAYIIWDPVEMYNHLTNNWGDKPHEIPFDIRQPASNQFMFRTFANWLEENPDVDVVRFTTFFYQFSLVFNQLGQEKFVDWFGYGASVSVKALKEFEEEKGYALRPEDFIDEGYYPSSFRIPTQRYLDYIDFTAKFVSQTAKKLVDMAHEKNKEAIMFLGDQWIGTEPYGKYFEEIGLDAVVGSVGDGTTLRMIADIPHVKYTEGRFLPYFFPDTFFEGNDPSIEAMENWLCARRAILRKPIDRMGYGGYLSLANKFPKFIDTVSAITNQFREIHAHTKGRKPYSGLKVAVLNCWGRLRTWQAFTVAHALYCKEAYSYHGILEALSGMNVDVEFISFDDVMEKEIDSSIDVMINAGDFGTAFSGGEIWKNEKLVANLRSWIHQGGGFVGVGEPTAWQHQGRFFQLADCFGLDKEVGFSLSTDKYFKEVTEKHFITEDTSSFHFGESMKNIYSLHADTTILEFSNDEIHLATNEFGKGRTVYIAGLPYCLENTRLLMRALYYAAGKEADMYHWFSTNLHCEVNVYPEQNVYCVINNTNDVQETIVYLGNDSQKACILKPNEIVWEEYE